MGEFVAGLTGGAIGPFWGALGLGAIVLVYEALGVRRTAGPRQNWPSSDHAFQAFFNSDLFPDTPPPGKLSFGSETKTVDPDTTAGW